MGWDEARIDTLKRLWLEGRSATEIARQLGGVTRNAVIGKVHRLGLSNAQGSPPHRMRSAFSHPAPSAPREIIEKKPRVLAPPKQVAPYVTQRDAAMLPRPSAQVIRIFASEGDYQVPGLPAARQCKWPIGDPQHPNFHFCPRRRPDDDSGPYCPEHAKAAYQPPTASQAKKRRDLAKDLRRYA